MGSCKYKEKWIKCSSHRVGNGYYHKMFKDINFRCKQLAVFYSSGVGMGKTKSCFRKAWFFKAEYPSTRRAKGMRMHVV